MTGSLAYCFPQSSLFLITILVLNLVTDFCILLIPIPACHRFCVRLSILTKNADHYSPQGFCGQESWLDYTFWGRYIHHGGCYTPSPLCRRSKYHSLDTQSIPSGLTPAGAQRRGSGHLVVSRRYCRNYNWPSDNDSTLFHHALLGERSLRFLI